MTQQEDIVVAIVLASCIAGCSSSEEPVTRQKPPRPATVLVLQQTRPQQRLQLDSDSDLIVGRLFDADGQALPKDKVPELVHDGDTVLYVRQRWRLRPGDLVRVDLDGNRLEPGFYVPANTILEKAGSHYVFRLEA